MTRDNDDEALELFQKRVLPLVGKLLDLCKEESGDVPVSVDALLTAAAVLVSYTGLSRVDFVDGAGASFEWAKLARHTFDLHAKA